MKKVVICLLVAFNVIYATQVPKKYPQDSRVTYTSYDKQNVFKVRCKAGFSTQIVFSKDERIVDVVPGFPSGWSFVDRDNYLYIKPLPVATQISVDSYGNQLQNEQEVQVQPNASDWRTNVIVTTNKKEYLFDLHISKYPIYKLTFIYPEDEFNKKLAKQKKLAKANEGKKIEDKLNRINVPKNWNYYMHVNKDSEDIAPNYAYDDGIFTYLAFDNTKTFPTAFMITGTKEQIVNTHVKKDGNFDVLVIHKVIKKAYLRSGEKLVGILNRSYGENPVIKRQNTISKDVERIIK